MNREKSIDRLYDAVTSTVELVCTKCRTVSQWYQLEEHAAAIHAHDNGWRGSPSHTYCPECASKYLKSK